MAQAAAESILQPRIFRLLVRKLRMHVQMKDDQFGEQLEHAQHRGIVQRIGPGIDGAEGAEEGAIGHDDRHRNIALKAVHRRRGMAVKGAVLGDMIDHHQLAAGTDLVADGGLDLQFAAGLEAEGDIVLHRAAHPAIVGDPGDGGKAHAGGAADHFQNRVHCRNRGDGVQFGLEIVRCIRRQQKQPFRPILRRACVPAPMPAWYGSRHSG